MGLDRPSDAIVAFKEAARLRPQDGTFQTALCGALSLVGSHTDAIAACEAGIRLSPDSADAHSALISAMRAAGRPAPELQRLIGTALARFRDSEQVLVLAAGYYAENGNFTDAAEIYERLLRLRPDSAYYHARLAAIYVHMERDADALAAARKALELAPNYPFAHFAMGRLFFELGQNEEASAAFEKAIAGDNDLLDAKYYFALSEQRRGRSSSAITALRSLVIRVPDDFNYNFELGSILNTSANYEEAIAPMQIASKLQPKNLAAKAGLGLALFESARFTEAIPVLEDAERLEPGNQIVTMFLNVARSRQQSIPQIEEMKKYASENSADLRVRMNLVQLLSYARRAPEAELYVQEIYKLDPKDVRYYQYIAAAYSTAGNDEKALDAYSRSMAIEENPGAYLGIASIHAKRGQAEQASIAYAKVIELKPNSPNIIKLYADHLRDNGKRREALDMYKRSLAQLPMNAPALFDAGLLSAKLGEPDSARIYLESLRTADPKLAKTLERCLRLKLWM